MLEERFCGDAQTRRDGSTQILAFLRDHVEGYRRAEVHNDARPAVFLKGSHAVGDAVRAHFLRVIVMDGHSRARPRSEEKRLQVKVLPSHFLEHGVLFQFGGDQRLEFERRGLEQRERLLELRREHQ